MSVLPHAELITGHSLTVRHSGSQFPLLRVVVRRKKLREKQRERDVREICQRWDGARSTLLISTHAGKGALNQERFSLQSKLFTTE